MQIFYGPVAFPQTPEVFSRVSCGLHGHAVITGRRPLVVQQALSLHCFFFSSCSPSFPRSLALFLGEIVEIIHFPGHPVERLVPAPSPSSEIVIPFSPHLPLSLLSPFLDAPPPPLPVPYLRMAKSFSSCQIYSFFQAGTQTQSNELGLENCFVDVAGDNSRANNKIPK